MKNICILRGSPRKQGNTNRLVNIMKAQLAREGHTVTDFDLHTMDIRPCVACRWCQQDWSQVSCVQKDDMHPIFDAVLDCDLLLLATPVYSWYCTPPMKAALDRLVYAMNMYYGDAMGPSLWAGKTVALIATCGYRPERGADLLEEGIRRYCKHSALHYGGMLCERHKNYQTEFMDQEKEQRALAFLSDLLSTL